MYTRGRRVHLVADYVVPTGYRLADEKEQMTCFVCGAPNDWRETMQKKPNSWKQRGSLHGYEATAPLLRDLRDNGSIPANTTYSWKEPVAPGGIPHNVLTPFLISVVSGTFPTVAAASFLSALGVPNSTLYGISVGGTVSLVSWYISVRAFYKLLWREEKVTGNGGDKKPAYVPNETIKVETTVRDERGRLKQMRWYEFPPEVRDADLEKLARALLLRGKPFSKRGLKGILSADKFSMIQNVLLVGRAARYVNGRNANGGVELRKSGREFLKQYIEANDDE